MSNKPIFITVGLLILIGLIGEILYYFGIFQFINGTSVAGGLGRIGGMILIISYGTLKKEKIVYSLILLSIACTILGALFKITHAPKADILISIGFYSIAVVYCIRFFKKDVKTRLDVLKVLWVIAVCLAILFAIRHYNFAFELKAIEGILFLLLFADFAYNHYRKSNLQPKENFR